MKKFVASVTIALALAGMPASANAKGCLKGALVGGIAGHYAAHHGVLGAAAGCIIGRHEANKAAQQNQYLPQRPAQSPASSRY